MEDRKIGHNLLEPAVPNAAKRNYRPPAGFMDKTLLGVDGVPQMPSNETEISKDKAIEALMRGNGGWYTLAQMLLALRGVHAMDSNDVSMVCEIAPLTQDKWMTAANVRTSLVADTRAAENAGGVEKLEAALDEQDAIEKLHAMRFMTLPERRDAIRLVMEQELNVPDTLDLVKAYKQYIDLEGDTLGFSGSARDRLAFFFYRRAQEQTRDASARQNHAERALSLAETKDARALCERLVKVADAEEAGASAANGAKNVGTPTVEVVRLERNETSFMPVPFLGDVSALTPTAIDGLPSAARRVGQFGVFTPGDGQWIALPMWQALINSSANKMFAVTCSSWRRFPGLTIKQLDDERLLVICEAMPPASAESEPSANDTAPAARAAAAGVAGNKYYLAWNSTPSADGEAGTSGQQLLKIVPGNEVLAQTAEAPVVPFARVLLACLPPSLRKAGKVL